MNTFFRSKKTSPLSVANVGKPGWIVATEDWVWTRTFTFFQNKSSITLKEYT